jgi:hypothetical protein
LDPLSKLVFYFYNIGVPRFCHETSTGKIFLETALSFCGKKGIYSSLSLCPSRLCLWGRFGVSYKGSAGHRGGVFLAARFGALIGFWELRSPCGNFWLYLFWFDIVFLELFPAIRCNLLCRTPAQKDFYFYRG